MHGSLRFLLATVVALSHLGVSLPGYNSGVMAVVIFYLLAGMVTSKLLNLIYRDAPLSYYHDRLLRIMPLYLYALVIALFAWYVGVQSTFISASPDFTDALANLTVIPLSYFMYTGQDAFTLIPPAWSLGVELQFYLLIPFLVMRKKLLSILFWGSFSIYVLAGMNIINTDYFGYRLLPGVFFIFTAGIYLHRALLLKDASALLNLKRLYSALILLGFAIYLKQSVTPYNVETLAALLIGIPVLFYYRTPFPRSWEKQLGSLSYGVFLLHFPSLWLLQHYVDPQVSVSLVLSFSILLSYIGHVSIEKNIYTNK